MMIDPTKTVNVAMKMKSVYLGISVDETKWPGIGVWSARSFE